MDSNFFEWYEKNGKGFRLICAIVGIGIGIGICKEIGLL